MSLNDLQKIQSQLNEAMQCLRAFAAKTCSTFQNSKSFFESLYTVDFLVYM